MKHGMKSEIVIAKEPRRDRRRLRILFLRFAEAVRARAQIAAGTLTQSTSTFSPVNGSCSMIFADVLPPPVVDFLAFFK
jgi:hypothetical protein